MPFVNEITIHPHQLQIILELLAAESWSQGPIVIRDTGSEYVVRDTEESFIASVQKEIDTSG